jgi:hypothetical protein
MEVFTGLILLNAIVKVGKGKVLFVLTGHKPYTNTN